MWLSYHIISYHLFSFYKSVSLLILMQLLFTPTDTNHVYLFIFPTVCRRPSDVIYYDHKDAN